jgi:hypothetical protein
MKPRSPHLLLATIGLQFVTDRDGNRNVKASSQFDDDLTAKERWMVIWALDDTTRELRRATMMMPPLRALYFGCSAADETDIFAVVVDSGGLPRAGEIFDALRPDIVQKCGMKEVDDDVVIPDECVNVVFRATDLYARVPELGLI